MSSRLPLLRCNSLRRIYQPGADVSHLLICVPSLFTRRDVSDIICLHPASPPHTLLPATLLSSLTSSVDVRAESLIKFH